MEALPHLRPLHAHAARLAPVPLARLIADDPARATDFAVRVGPLYASFARQRYDREALEALFAMAEGAGVAGAVRALFDGVPVNATEGRPALHTALRSDLSAAPAARAAHAQARDGLAAMRATLDALHALGATDVVSVGIGGSDLGPRMIVDALAAPGSGVRMHFLSNVDGAAAARTIAGLDPRRTAAVLVSKSFGTQETLLNGTILRSWLGDDSRLFAVTANAARAETFGVRSAHILPMWDWVGGRYSLWSACGLPIALALGMDVFEALLAGAAEMDAHVLDAPARDNLAYWHALTAVWNRNAMGFPSQGVFPYDERLRLLPAHLQQVVMESLGKSTSVDGHPVGAATSPIVWGGIGTDVQHSFFQMLHQGSDCVPADFIGVVNADHPHADNHRALLANLLGQAEALANGQASDDPHRAEPGNRPSTMLLLDRLTPRTLGMLVALYEHSVYLQSVLWGINAFDQFGVELGKQIAGRLLPAIEGAGVPSDPVTAALLEQLRHDR
jgi:glucose-6-phosphate isomerase